MGLFQTYLTKVYNSWSTNLPQDPKSGTHYQYSSFIQYKLDHTITMMRNKIQGFEDPSMKKLSAAETLEVILYLNDTINFYRRLFEEANEQFETSVLDLKAQISLLRSEVSILNNHVTEIKQSKNDHK